MHDTPLLNFNHFLEILMDRWLTDMFNKVKMTPPPPSERVRLAQEAEEWITPRVKSAYPGIITAITELKNRGYTLSTASGETSWTLKGYLSGMGIIDCFTNFYGPDLINTAKFSSKFYQEIIDDMNISPSDGIIVDDSSLQLAFAKKLGLSTIHVLNDSKCEELSCDYHINHSNELSDLMQNIENESPNKGNY
jgi:phosphoglycolate phosphatase-like HAD superfamily hydrolase